MPAAAIFAADGAGYRLRAVQANGCTQPARGMGKIIENASRSDAPRHSCHGYTRPRMHRAAREVQSLNVGDRAGTGERGLSAMAGSPGKVCRPILEIALRNRRVS